MIVIAAIKNLVKIKKIVAGLFLIFQKENLVMMPKKEKEKKQMQNNSMKGRAQKERATRPSRFASYLTKIYEDPKSSVAFTSPQTLYKEARKKFSNITLKDVKDYLQGKLSYVRFKHVKRNFPRRKVIVSGPQIQYQADLVDFAPIQRENDNFRFLLTVIDCFSRFAIAIPQRSKSAADTLRAMEKAFKFMGFPKILQTDEGGEFFNKDSARFFIRCKIRHFHTKQVVKAQIVERFNRTLRERLTKFMVSRKSLRYIDALSDLLFAYNNSKHGAFQKMYAPVDITKRNEKIRNLTEMITLIRKAN